MTIRLPGFVIWVLNAAPYAITAVFWLAACGALVAMVTDHRYLAGPAVVVMGLAYVAGKLHDELVGLLSTEYDPESVNQS
jgi:hypothetical protein